MRVLRVAMRCSAETVIVRTARAATRVQVNVAYATRANSTNHRETGTAAATKSASGGVVNVRGDL